MVKQLFAPITASLHLSKDRNSKSAIISTTKPRPNH